jgi:hypothetical protein
MAAQVIPTYVVIPTRGRDTLDECAAAIASQVDGVVLIDTSPAAGDLPIGVHTALYRIHYRGDRNISRWWNLGFTATDAAPGTGRQWNVVVLNDDVIVPPGWVETMTIALRAGTADLVYPENASGKIAGYAFVLRGESRLLADESLAWWYGDDDLEFQARAGGGAVAVYADPELQAQAAKDRERFAEKWGQLP